MLRLERTFLGYAKVFGLCIAEGIQLNTDLASRFEERAYPALQEIAGADRFRVLFEENDILGRKLHR